MFENSLVKTVSKVSLWIAPLPSAYFVSRSSVAHLGVTFPFQYLIAVVVELLGISSFHTLLWLYGWRQESLTDKGNLRAGYSEVTGLEIALSVIFGAVYLLTTVSIIVALEVSPQWSVFAPALFPAMSIVGAANLALIARQETRERILGEYNASKGVKKAPVQQSVKMSSNSKGTGRAALKEARKQLLRTRLLDRPNLTPTEAAQELGVSRTTIYSYLDELEKENKR